MSITHSRLVRIEKEAGVSNNWMFVFKAHPDHFSVDDFIRLVDRAPRDSDLIVRINLYPLGMELSAEELAPKLLSTKELS